MNQILRNIIINNLSNLINELSINSKSDVKNNKDFYNYLERICELLFRHRNDSPNVLYNLIINDYLKSVNGITKIVSGLATSIKDDVSGIQLETYSGSTCDNGIIVSDDTRFDFASVTKMFTSMEELKLIEEGKFDRNILVSDLKNGKYRLDIPVSDLERFNRRIVTDGRLDDNISKEELERRLTESKVDFSYKYEYNDIPYIILKDLFPTNENYFMKYYFDEMGLYNTSYRTFGSMTGGNYDEIDKPYDKKAKNLMKYGYKEPGHSGLFGTSRDLVKLYDKLKSGFLSKDSLKELVRLGIPDLYCYKSPNGRVVYVTKAMGVFVKDVSGFLYSEVHPVLSIDAFSASGSSGSYSTYDLNNKLTANFLSNPYSSNETRIIEMDNKEYTLHNSFDDGTLLKVHQKQIEILDKNGEAIKEIKDGKELLDKNGNPKTVKIKFVEITNNLKEMQINTIFALRLANNFLYERAKLLEDERIINELNTSDLGKNSKKILHL